MASGVFQGWGLDAFWAGLEMLSVVVPSFGADGATCVLTLSYLLAHSP